MDEHLLSKLKSAMAGLLIAHAGSDDSSGRLASGQVGRRVLLRESTVNEWIRNHEQRKEVC